MKIFKDLIETTKLADVGKFYSKVQRIIIFYLNQ